MKFEITLIISGLKVKTNCGQRPPNGIVPISALDLTEISCVCRIYKKEADIIKILFTSFILGASLYCIHFKPHGYNICYIIIHTT